jgi:hypothetical protein
MKDDTKEKMIDVLNDYLDERKELGRVFNLLKTVEQSNAGPGKLERFTKAVLNLSSPAEDKNATHLAISFWLGEELLNAAIARFEELEKQFDSESYKPE